MKRSVKYNKDNTDNYKLICIKYIEVSYYININISYATKYIDKIPKYKPRVSKTQMP